MALYSKSRSYGYPVVSKGGTKVKCGCETGQNMNPSMASRGSMAPKRSFDRDASTSTARNVRTNSKVRSYTRGSQMGTSNY